MLAQTSHDEIVEEDKVFERKDRFDLKTSVNINNKLEDLKVLRRSPDLLNNVKIGQGHRSA